MGSCEEMGFGPLKYEVLQLGVKSVSGGQVAK